MVMVIRSLADGPKERILNDMDGPHDLFPLQFTWYLERQRLIKSAHGSNVAPQLPRLAV